MTSLPAVLVGLALAFGITFAAERRITPTWLLLASMGMSTVGYALVSNNASSSSNAWTIATAPVGFALGVLFSRTIRSRREEPHSTPSPKLTDGRACPLALAIVLLSGYHFVAGGIPALADSVETSRFHFQASGLFGIPSRATLFALPILVVAYSIFPAATTRSTRVILWAALLLSRMALGFKSGLLEVVIIAATVLLVRRDISHKRAVWLGTVLVTAAVAYATLIGNTYQTIAAAGGVDATYIFSRLTVGAAAPAEVALRLVDAGIWQGSAAIHDLKYFSGTYLPAVSGPAYAFDQFVSSIMTGTPIRTNAFIVPVTVGGPSYLVASVPVMLVPLSLMVFGGVWSRGLALLLRPRSLQWSLVGSTLLLAVRAFMLNGGGAYVLINYGAVLVGLLAVLMSLRGHRALAGSKVGLSVDAKRGSKR